jgi:hypothetical protein
LDKGKAYKAIDRLAVHDIRGKLKTLESLGIISRTEVRKRLKNDLPITERYEKHGENFVAPINQRLLKNEIDHKICGRDWSTSNAIKNKQGCKNFSNKFVEQIDQSRFASANSKDASLSTFANTISKRYST